MKKLLSLLLITIPLGFTYGQWTVPSPPMVDTLGYTITDTIYMSADGDDILGDGSSMNPVKTFLKASQLLPFSNVNNYGLIILKAGDYYPTGSMDFWQVPGQWQQSVGGTHYKNISVLGEDNVVIHGDSIISPVLGHPLMRLRGSHIFVKNIELKNSPGHGLSFTLTNESMYNSHTEAEGERSKHIVLDGVKVDGATGHGIFAKYVDMILVENCEVSHTSEQYQFDAGTTAWGGAIKFDFSSNITCRNNYVHENYGEGINLSLSYNSVSHNNRLHDNRASHIYSMNARRAIIRNNLIYTLYSDTTFWTPHPIGRAATGISIRNEFKWGNSWGIGYNGLTYVGTAVLGNDRRLYTHPQGGSRVQWSKTDSISVFNNIILNAGWAIAINDANAGEDPLWMLWGEDCIFNNISIHHNTCYGWRGADTHPGRLVSIVETHASSIASNISIDDNIFLLDPVDTGYINWVNVNHPSAFSFNNNLWNGDPATLDYNGSNALITDYFPVGITQDSLFGLNPSCTNELEVASISAPSYLVNDYYDTLRVNPTNVGAMEKVICVAGISEVALVDNVFLAYPNPTTGKVYLKSPESIDELLLFNDHGQLIVNTKNPTAIDLSEYPDGIYFLIFKSGENSTGHRLVKQ